MKKRLYFTCLAVLVAVFALIGCNDDGEYIEEVSENSICEEPDSEENIADEEDMDKTEENTSEVIAVEESDAEAEEVSEEVVLEDSPIIPMDTVLYVQREVNVRSGPGTDYEKLGALAVNTEVTVTGQDKESGWYQIEYEEAVGFVSDSYLGEGKVEITTASDNTVEQSSEPTSNNNNVSGNEETSDGWFSGDDMMDALQWHQQMTP